MYTPTGIAIDVAVLRGGAVQENQLLRFEFELD
jgi:hypothetical protein